MNRLTNKEFQQSKRKFVPYIMSGDPDYETAVKIALTLEEAGADAVEWGVPFSDPLADGPVIQEAGARSRKGGGNLKTAIKGIKEARASGLKVPVILFTYINPVLSLGFDTLIDEMAAADIDGLLIPDLPFEESEEIRKLCRENNVSLISLAAPSSRTRMEKIGSSGDGFLYYVTSLGVTGTRESFSEDLEDNIGRLKKYSTVPVLAGFGISSAEHVRFFNGIADGVIVGSALVKFIAEREAELKQENTRVKALNEIKGFVQELIS